MQMPMEFEYRGGRWVCAHCGDEANFSMGCGCKKESGEQRKLSDQQMLAATPAWQGKLRQQE